MAEEEGSFEERFSETVRQFPVVWDNGSFSLLLRYKEFAYALVSALVLASLVKTWLKSRVNCETENVHCALLNDVRR